MNKKSSTLILESTYLIKSNKKNCEKIFESNNYSENNIIDILISLHSILEIGINGLFRVISNPPFRDDVDILERIEKMDNVNFIDKITMFIYLGNFKFTKKPERAIEYRKIIEVMKDFSSIRNSLLHGHALSTIHDFNTQDKRNTKTQAKLNKEFLDKQIKKF